MADIKVRNLDERVTEALRLRAKRHGVSLEEEVRRTLTESVQATRAEAFRLAAEARERTKGSWTPENDSVRIIREWRDKMG